MSSKNSGNGNRQDSPMVDEMFDDQMHFAMEIVDSEDSTLTTASSSANAAANGSGANANSENSSGILFNSLSAANQVVHNDFKKNFNIDFFDDFDLN